MVEFAEVYQIHSPQGNLSGETTCILSATRGRQTQQGERDRNRVWFLEQKNRRPKTDSAKGPDYALCVS